MSLTKVSYSMINGSPINVKDYGAVGDGLTDDTAAIQAAITDIIALGGGQIYVPNPPVYYKCTSTLTLTSTPNSIEFVGDGIWNSEIKLVSAVADTLFDNTAGRLTFSDMSISGMPTSGNVFRAGDIGIVSSGVVRMKNVSFYGFENLMKWEGGFYHKFTGCDFRFADTCFIGFNANNLVFDRCQAEAFNSFCSVNGGSGPVSFTNGSLEQWTTRLFTSTDGALVQNLNLHNTYIENYPSTAVAAGLTGSFYNNGFGIVGYQTISLIGNMISMKGVRRLISNSATSNITSVGNRFIYQTGTTSECDFIYSFTNLKSGTFNDYAAAELAAGSGTFTTGYISGTYSNFLASSVYDPIIGTDVSPRLVLGVNVGDESATLTVATSRPRQIWATPLTADRAATLSTTGASSGATFEIVRTAAATGAFNLNIGTGPLKSLAVGQWCEVTYNGSAWILTKFGIL